MIIYVTDKNFLGGLVFIALFLLMYKPCHCYCDDKLYSSPVDSLSLKLIYVFPWDLRRDFEEH